MVERGGFEPPVPLRLTWAEFGPSSGHHCAQIRASVLERICSPGVRPCFGSLRFPSFARLMLGIWVTSNMRDEGLEFKSPLLGGQSSKASPG